MQVFEKIGPLRDTLAGHRNSGKRIGLVPTMGYLHKGHASLIIKAVEQCDVVVCSIYVNPQQFNDASDLTNYPKSWEKDLEMASGLGCDIIFKPSDEEMYPEAPGITIDAPSITSTMEGAFRPGHFQGVGLVVLKLLNIIEPQSAYFGEKDLQQLALIRRLASDLNIHTQIIGVETQREASGLALSSRNARLSDTERVQAAGIYQALSATSRHIQQTRNIGEALAEGKKVLEHAGIVPEYFEVVDRGTFEPLETPARNSEMAVCIAAPVGNVRLIDNLLIRMKNDH